MLLYIKGTNALGEMADSKTGQGRCSMSLHYLVVAESKKELKNKNTMMGVCQKDQEPTERALSGQSRNSLSNNINKIVLGYNPKF